MQRFLKHLIYPFLSLSGILTLSFHVRYFRSLICQFTNVSIQAQLITTYYKFIGQMNETAD
jgi:hypothetical protein